MNHFVSIRSFFTSLAAIVLLIAVQIVSISPVFAAPRKGYEASLQKFVEPLVFSPGEQKVVDIAFVNTGTTTWKNAGDAYVSLYTTQARYRKSSFAARDWLDASHPVALKEVSVAPKSVGHFTFTLQAPEKVGSYKESFALASENTTWIPGGDVSLTITVKSAARKGYEAVNLSQNTSLTMSPGETQEIELTYKNIGTTTWKNTGAAYVSAYTFDPKYHKSLFANKAWVSDTQAMRLKEASVAPGALGHFVLSLTAPKNVGTYTETLNLVAEDTTWIPGGVIKLSITVDEKSTLAPAVVPVPSSDDAPASKPLSGMILLRSQKTVVANGGEEIMYKVGIKNTGTATWSKREVRLPETVATAASTNENPAQLALNTDGIVSPGAIDFLSFPIITPSVKGTYLVSYHFVVNGVVVPDAQIDIPIEVTSDAADVLNSPIVHEHELQNVIAEPVLRIGVLIVDEETENQVVISCNTDWKLMDGNGALLGELKPNESTSAFYKNNRYYFNRGKGLEQSSFFLRFVPVTDTAICKIENFDKRKTRRGGYAENTFHQGLELRYNSAKDRTWVINEVKMEDYLAGLGETSELSDFEFKKTLIIIARTYALYHWERATKHASEYFHMTAYSDDQVYRGYEYETNHPSIGRAARETRGVTVNYQGKTAITPYFSRSDGRTRNWNEVWYGTVAWIISVPTPCDAAKGSTLWGHGVGLAASEALCMARNGKTSDEILKYFYRGIDLLKRWN